MWVWVCACVRACVRACVCVSGKVGQRDMFSAVIFCIMDLIFLKSSMSVYYYQFKCCSLCSDVLFTFKKKRINEPLVVS